MKKFYSLKVKKIENLTHDSVKIVFENSSPEFFKFQAGQYITLRCSINNDDIRRSYSLSSAPNHGLEIGVRRVENGLMSTYLTKDLKINDYIDVMPPTGDFYISSKKKQNHYVAICAGSGITPILSMIKHVLKAEPDSYFTLIFGNRKRSTIMFADDLRDLEENFQSQFFINYLFSREKIADFLYGRIDRFTLNQIFQQNNNLKDVDCFFLCGPGLMIDNANNFLLDIGIDDSRIKFERFGSFISDIKSADSDNDELLSNVLVSVDGDDFEFTLSSKGESILDAAINAGADVPFSCKGGVCCVCKAKVIEGSVAMDQNYSLSDDEVAAGYILGCQSHPASENVVVDFDEI